MRRHPADSFGPIDHGNPVNPDHPLNRGRVAWYLSLAGLSGGSKFPDLMGGSGGTLTNMAVAGTSSASGWGKAAGPARPGALGPPILCDGTDDYISGPAGASGLVTNWSMACTFYLSSASQHGMAFKVGGAGNTNGVGIGVGASDADTNGNNLLVLFESRRWIVAKTSIGTGWFRAVTTLNASGFPTIFLNAAQVYTDTTNGPLAASNAVGIGGYNVAGRYFAGPIDDCTVINRAWAPTDVAADYGLSSRQYPGVLNRRRTPIAVFQMAGGVGGVAVAFSASLADQALASSLTATAPPDRTVAFAATVGDQTLASSVTPAPAPARTAAFAATLGDQGLASSVTAAAPGAQAVAFAATLADQTLTASMTATAPPARTVAFAVTLGDQGLAASVVAAAPPDRTVAFAVTTGDQALAAVILTAAPGTRAVAFAATVGDAGLASSLTPAAPPGRTAVFAATLGDQGLSASLTAAGPAGRTVAFAATLGGQTLSSSVTTAALSPPPPSPSTGSVDPGVFLMLEGSPAALPPVQAGAGAEPEALLLLLGGPAAPPPPPPFVGMDPVLLLLLDPPGPAGPTPPTPAAPADRLAGLGELAGYALAGG
jgi:hypothetical protein